MERTFEIARQYVRRLFCDKCEGIEMQRSNAPTIARAPGQPPRHTYRCPKCRATQVSDIIYPNAMSDIVELVAASDVQPIEAENN